MRVRVALAVLPLASVTLQVHVFEPELTKRDEVHVVSVPVCETDSPENTMDAMLDPVPADAVAVSLMVEYPCTKMPQPLTVLLEDWFDPARETVGLTDEGTVTVKFFDVEPRFVDPLNVVTVTFPVFEVALGIWSHHDVGIVNVLLVAMLVYDADREPSSTFTVCV